MLLSAPDKRRSAIDAAGNGAPGVRAGAGVAQ
jgi:hypothetical protein